jgi:hypothetical protein
MVEFIKCKVIVDFSSLVGVFVLYCVLHYTALLLQDLEEALR